MSKYHCDLCGHITSSTSGMRSHQKTKHPNRETGYQYTRVYSPSPTIVQPVNNLGVVTLFNSSSESNSDNEPSDNERPPSVKRSRSRSNIDIGDDGPSNTNAVPRPPNYNHIVDYNYGANPIRLVSNDIVNKAFREHRALSDELRGVPNAPSAPSASRSLGTQIETVMNNASELTHQIALLQDEFRHFQAVADLEKQQRLEAEKQAALRREDEIDAKCCCICVDRERSHILIPCGHLVLCHQCAMSYRGSQNACPICKAAIAAIYAVYMS